MLLLSHQYYILLGHFGSGKTELSLAIARQLGHGTALVDLDIVNPYFRSSEHKNVLLEEGIDVIMPSFANTTVDVPALSADVQAVFQSDRYKHVVIDVGGDPAGATALGRYHPLIQPLRERMQVLFRRQSFMRPLTAKEEDICISFHPAYQSSRAYSNRHAWSTTQISNAKPQYGS